MASCFWVGGTATWDSTNTGGGGAGGIKWASATGGGTTAAGGGTGGSPSTGDTAIFDSASGGGTVTVNTTVSITALTCSTFTGTLDFGTNNNNVTAGTVDFSGAGVRTINMGSGTWTLTGTSGNVLLGNGTNLTPTFSNAAIIFSGNGNSRTWQAGTPAGGYGATTVNNNSVPGSLNIISATTVASLTVGSGTTIGTSGITITGALNITGTSSAPSGLAMSNFSTASSVSVGSASTLTWTGICGITKAGAGSITATNSFDMGRNSGFVSIASPSGGGVTGVIGG